MSNDRRAMLTMIASVAGCVGLAGCGLRPIYAGGTGMGVGRLYIDQIEGRFGFLLRNELEAYVAREPARTGSLPRLVVTVDTQYLDAAFRQDSYADRVIIVVSATWALQPADGGEIASKSGAVSVRDSFDSRDRSFSAVNLQMAAEENLSRELARVLWLDVAAKVRQ